MKKSIWIVIVVVILLVEVYSASQSSTFIAYPVQCNDWIMPSYPWTVTAPDIQDFSHCAKPEAMDRQTFSVDISKNQVTEISPDTADVYKLNYCTIQDSQHWSCGNGDYSGMPGGMVAATKINRSSDNFAEYGLSTMIFVTKSQWDSINGGKSSVCGSKWCDSSQ